MTTIQERLAFVTSVPTENINFAGVGLRDLEFSKRAQSYVNDGAIVGCASQLSKKARQDVLESMLFAQRAASGRRKRFRNPKQWYEEYVRSLGTLGWSVQQTDWRLFVVSGARFTAAKELLDVLRAGLSDSQVALLNASLEALNSLSDEDERIVLFKKHSEAKTIGSFQVGMASKSRMGTTMHLGMFRLQTKRSYKRVLFFKFSKKQTTVHFRLDRVILNDKIYKRLRRTVRDQLSSDAKTHIKTVTTV